MFADGNIEWFNPTTREIRFRDLEPAKAFVPYREIVFRLDDETLFAAATIVFGREQPDLLRPCALPQRPGRASLLSERRLSALGRRFGRGRANAEARAEGWNKFLEQLRQDGRLQK